MNDLLNNPTPKFSQTNLYNDYVTYTTKIDNMIDQINATSCTQSIKDNINNSLTTLKNDFIQLVSDSVDLANRFYNTSVSVSYKIYEKFSDSTITNLQSFRDQCVTSMDYLLDSNHLTNVKSAIDNIQSTIDSNINDCASLETNTISSINNAETEISNTNTLLVDKNNGLDNYESFTQQVTDLMGKCLTLASYDQSNQDSLSSSAGIYDTSAESVLNEVANTSGSMGIKANAGITKIEQAKDIPTNLDTFKTQITF